MINYDFIISGLGCAGMTLVTLLLDSPLRNKKILLIDYSNKSTNDRTWCYWGEKPLDLHPKNAPLVYWDHINVINGNTQNKKPLKNLKYYHIKSSDFYTEVMQRIEKFPNVTFVQDHITNFEGIDDNQILVHTKNSGTFSTSKVFNSIIKVEDLSNEKIIKQSFLGWKIRTTKPVFDKQAATLMHFTKDRAELTDFFYILPFDDREALIEYTVYTTRGMTISQMEEKLIKYIEVDLEIKEYDILFREKGIIPMTTKYASSPVHPNIVPIGSLAGCTKPSTGYTFYDIQKHCAQIMTELLSDHKPNFIWRRKSRFGFYDNIILNIASKWPKELPDIFKEMFGNNQPDLILKFLNEESGLLDEIKILSKLKYKIFIKSLLNYERH